MGLIKNPIALKLLNWFEKCCYVHADACIGLSPGIVTGIEQKKPEERTVLIPNGFHLELFDNVDSQQAFFRIIFPEKIGTDDFVAIFCGANGRANGLDAILNATVELKLRNKLNTKLLFVGDGQLKKQLQARADREHLSNCIFLYPVPKTELKALLKVCDLGLMILAACRT